MEELRGQTLGDGREDLSDSLLTLLSSPNIASKRWTYEQYDHEVGIRTVLKPGEADASLLRLPNGSMLAVKADGNSTHSYLNPKRGGAGCVAEASRNVAAVGAEPIAMVNHLQFGDPSDEEVYWTFEQTIEGMAQYCTTLPLPIVGGKVSFYNEDASSKRAIKPSPVALVVGLLPSPSEKRISQAFAAAGDESVFVIGTTAAELGGSEYCERVLKQQGGEVPLADANNDSRAYAAIRRLVGSGIVNSVHDCSRGGLSVAIAEMCFPASVGANIDVGPICAEGLTHSEALFSESHGRFVVSTNSTSKLSRILTAAGVPFTQVGKTGGNTLVFLNNGKKLARLKIDAAADAWRGGVSRLME
jgi:phosphoribosylformylglycinamidine synthase